MNIKLLWQTFLLAAALGGIAPVAALELKGDLSQGGLVIGQTQPDSQVFLDGRRIKLSDRGLFVFGFGRDAPDKAVLLIETATDKQQKILSVHRRQYDEQHIKGLPEEMVTPPVAVLEQIRKEGWLITEARRQNNPYSDVFNGFIWPVQGRISGVYGSRRILNGQPRRPHYGIDIAAPAGTPVKAPAGGKITLAYSDMYFSGATMVIDHGYGVSSTLLHLSKFLVKEGDAVKQGQVIAEVGSSGRSTGAHLDWRVNWLEQRLDPAMLVDEMPVQ